MGSQSPIIPIWIDNQDVSSSVTFPVVNGATGQVVHEAYGADAEIAIRAADSAEKAFSTWRNVDPWERRKLLQGAAAYLRSRRDEVTAIIHCETPIPRQMVEEINLNNSIGLLDELASAVTHLTNGVIPHTRDTNSMAMVVKEPYGVHLGIAPWNASLFLALRAVMTPIACGNTAILKASELSPKIQHFIGRMLKDVGFPAGVLNVIQHRREDASSVVEALVSHRAVKKVNFTGSTAVGRIVASLAGRYCKPTLMELGGKAPQIVFADADLDKAAGAAVVGSLLHHGQICMGTEKIIVHRSILDSFLEKLAVEGQKFPLTSAVSRQGAEKTEALVQDAIQQGAVDILSRKNENGVKAHGNHELFAANAQLRPTILTGVTPGMRLYSEESFGPTATVHPFDTDDEAISLANDSEYGLSASVFSRDITKAMWAAKRIESGSVHINSMTVHDEPQLPHGGMKSSGWGRFGVPWGFDEFLQQKTITIASEGPL